MKRPPLCLKTLCPTFERVCLPKYSIFNYVLNSGFFFCDNSFPCTIAKVSTEAPAFLHVLCSTISAAHCLKILNETLKNLET